VSVDDFAADGVEGKTHLSDHLPIWIDLGVDGAEV
jgi:endonuclease/exonuclease/phosphatase family metal-dependent hydrolase